MQHDVRGGPGCGEMRDALESVGHDVSASQHCQYTRHCLGGLGFDGTDQRMGVRRTHHGTVDLSREVEIVAIAAAAGDEARVFLTSYSRSDACVHDGEKYKLSVGRDADILTVLRAGLPGLQLLLVAAHALAAMVFCSFREA